MKYLKLINLTLEELNFKTVTSFGELVKPYHKRLLSIINRVNDIVLDSCDWQFMLRECVLNVPAGASSVEIPVGLQIRTVYCDKEQLHFTDECDRHRNGCGFSGEYAVFGQNLLLKPAEQARELKIIYVTKNHAKTAQGEEIAQMERGDDETLIPDNHAQNLVVFGSCLQFKSNTEHPKYKYWLSMFTDARAAMRASSEFVVPVPPRMVLPDWAVGFDRYRFGRFHA